MKDFMSGSESKFFDWAEYTFPYATSPENTAKWALPADAVSEDLLTAYKELGINYLRATNPETRTTASIQAKNNSIKHFKSIFRKYIKAYITYNPRVTDEDRKIMQLPLHDTKPTPAPVADKTPFTKLDLPTPGTVVISFGDQEGARKRKPAGQNGAELAYAILDNKPMDWEDLTHSTFSTHSPFRLSFKGTERGKTLYFALRWQNTRGEKGPWTEIMNVIIP
jgi:hypothetical protein